MPILSNRRSYAETVEGRRRLLSRLLILLIVFLGFEFLVGIFVAAYSVSSLSMEPTITPGERLLVSPIVYGPATPFGKFPPPFKPQRGDLALFSSPYAEPPSFWIALADSFVRFITFQRLSLAGQEVNGPLSGPFVKRVIGLPGDTVKMEAFVFMVKPEGEEHFLTEFELSKLRYDITKPQLPDGWSESFPLSASMGPRVLGKDEYFVAGDNRGASSDSRLWGPIGIDCFKAKVFLRYWPLGRLGAP